MVSPVNLYDQIPPGQLSDWATCYMNPVHFVRRHVNIYDAATQQWRPFNLWPPQEDTLWLMKAEHKLVILKARQLGISWLCLAYALWLMMFRAPATILLFSLREEESKELLWRLREMYHRLPEWMWGDPEPKVDALRWQIDNGSRALAFSTRAGRSYTGTLAIVDEADFVPDLCRFLNAVKPTIDGGGQLFLVSTSDKHQPVSTFKNLFRAAQAASSGRAGAGDYRPVFLPWQSRPDRDDAWHDRVQAEMFAQRGTHDDFYAEYPATPEQALAAEQLDRRIPLEWLHRCLDTGRYPLPNTGPALPGLVLWELPLPGRRYVIGADPAEGNPHSDDSAAIVLDGETWSEVASLTGKLEPTTFAAYLDELGRYYNAADVLPERNNHGHLLIRELQRLGNLRVLDGYDGKPGWLSNIKGKPLLYGILADAIHERQCTVRSSETATQLASIEASTLRAPTGLHDDRADAFALALAAVAWKPAVQASAIAEAVDPLTEYDREAW